MRHTVDLLSVLNFLPVFAVCTNILCRWSCDGCYFARMTLDTLSVYETPVSNLIVWIKLGIHCVPEEMIPLNIFLLRSANLH